jgi:hypothetical protein
MYLPVKRGIYIFFNAIIPSSARPLHLPLAALFLLIPSGLLLLTLYFAKMDMDMSLFGDAAYDHTASIFDRSRPFVVLDDDCEAKEKLDKERDEDLMCSICVEKAESPDAFTLTCGHIFHTKCIRTAFRKCAKNCPMCRMPSQLMEQRAIKVAYERMLDVYDRHFMAKYGVCVHDVSSDDSDEDDIGVPRHLGVQAPVAIEAQIRAFGIDYDDI